MRIYVLIFLIHALLQSTSKFAFECTNGKDPKKMSKKDYLIEFSKGPCSPAIFLNSLLGMRLSIQILDCQSFKETYSEEFKNCGFTDCSKKQNEYWKKVPKSEYFLWIPDPFSPMSIVSLTKKNGNCFASLFLRKIDFSKPIESSLIENSSFRIRLYGNTPGTKGKERCGDTAIRDLAPMPNPEKSTIVFGKMLDEIKTMGYVAGLTYQAIPYDGLKSYRNNELKNRFKNNLERLYNLTQKRVIIIGHSFGNNNIYYQLTRLSTNEKNKMVKTWISFGFATLGSPEVQGSIIAGSDYFMFLNGLIGVRAEASIKFIANQPGSFENLERNPYTIFEGQNWFKAFNARINYEKGETSFEDSGFDFLPKITEICSPKNFNHTQNCTLGLMDRKNTVIIEVENKTYQLNQTRDLIEEWKTDPNSVNFYDHTIDKQFELLKNPGVPVIMFALRTIPTIGGSKYLENVKQAVKLGRFPKVMRKMIDGDGTVIANSLFAGYLKWAYEFEHKIVSEAKAVKFVDFCSVYKQRDSPYDSKSDKNELLMTTNEFFGLSCDCIESQDAVGCNHARMIGDSHAIKFTKNTLLANEGGYSKDFEAYINNLSDQYLIDISEKCVQLQDDDIIAKYEAVIL